MTYKLYFTNGGEPSANERRDLTEAYNAYATFLDRHPEEEGSYADSLIDLLLAFASIEVEEMDDDYRECDNCGDDVRTLSTRNWCDGCEEEAERDMSEARASGFSLPFADEASVIRDSFSDRVVGHVMPETQTIKLLSNPGPDAPSFSQPTVIRHTLPYGLGIAPEGATGQPYPHVQIEGGEA